MLAVLDRERDKTVQLADTSGRGSQ